MKPYRSPKETLNETLHEVLTEKPIKETLQKP